jgi:hypothetical protein
MTTDDFLAFQPSLRDSRRLWFEPGAKATGLFSMRPFGTPTGTQAGFTESEMRRTRIDFGMTA